MDSFGTTGYMTLEPNNSTQEEQISFTGLTQNANGTATLTGVKTVLFISPFTETSGTAKAHPGGSVAVVTNTSGFYNSFANRFNTQTVTGLWTFPSGTNRPVLDADVNTTNDAGLITLGQLSRQAISGASNASTTVKGLVELATQGETDSKQTTGATGALLALTPDKLRAAKYNDYVADTGTATAYAIAPSPVITVYVAGLEFRFKAKSTNAASPTLNVNGIGAKNLYYGKSPISPRSIITSTIVGVVYDGTQFQVLATSKPKVSQEGGEIYGTSTGVGTAYAVGLSPVLTAYTPGLVVRFMPDTASSGGATLNVNSLGAKTIVTGPNSQTVLTSNDIPASVVSEVVYDGTNFELVAPKSATRKVKVSTTAVALSGGFTETNIVSFWLPGLILGTNNSVRVTIPGAAIGITQTQTATLNLKYGGTTIASYTIGATAGTGDVGVSGKLEAIISGNAATNAQVGSLVGGKALWCC
jgi:hypothetical protein